MTEDESSDRAIERPEQDVDLVDEAAAEAVQEARSLGRLGTVEKSDGNGIEFSLNPVELGIISRAINYRNVDDPAKRREQQTFVAINHESISFKTSRVGTSCSVTFPLTSLSGEVPEDGIAVELEPHILPFLTRIDKGHNSISLKFDRGSETLRVETKKRFRGEEQFYIELCAKHATPEKVFSQGLEGCVSLGERSADAFRRGIEFARSIARREAGDTSPRDLTFRNGLVFGGHTQGVTWCNHGAFAGINASVAHEHSRDISRLLYRFGVAATVSMDSDRLIFQDGPITCTCDITKPSMPIPPAVERNPEPSIVVSRGSLYLQAHLLAELDKKSGQRSIVAGKVRVATEPELELQLLTRPRNDNLRGLARLPLLSQEIPANNEDWTFSVDVGDFAKIIELLNVAAIRIGKLGPKGIRIDDPNAGSEIFAGVLVETTPPAIGATQHDRLKNAGTRI